MNGPALRALLIEDNPGDAELVRQALLSARGGARFELECAGRLDEGLERLAASPADVILLDISLPDSRGFETFARVHAQDPRTPIVLLTGLNDDELAVRIIREGAADFVVKEDLGPQTLDRALRYAIERKRCADLARSNVELDSFALAASHDLQEPLRKIETFGESLERHSGPALDEEGRRHVARMRDAASRLRAMIDALLSCARVDGGGAPLAAVDLGNAVRDALSDLETAVSRSRAMVSVGPLPSLKGDPAQLRQLFYKCASINKLGI